jgi:type I restriction enzyme S subunit
VSELWEIPANWEWSRMGEIANVVGGGTPDTKKASYFGGDIPWLTPADLSGYTAKCISRGARSITQAGLDDSGAQLMPAGSVLFSSRAPIGYVVIASNPICTNQGFKSFVLDGGLNPDFVYYYLHRAKPLAVKLASGTTFLEISGTNAARIPIPVPPAAEQLRIADALDELLSELDIGWRRPPPNCSSVSSPNATGAGKRSNSASSRRRGASRRRTGNRNTRSRRLRTRPTCHQFRRHGVGRCCHT